MTPSINPALNNYFNSAHDYINKNVVAPVSSKLNETNQKISATVNAINDSEAFKTASQATAKATKASADVTVTATVALVNNPIALGVAGATVGGFIAPIIGVPLAAGLVVGQKAKEVKGIDITAPLEAAGGFWRKGNLQKAVVIGGIAAGILCTPPVAYPVVMPLAIAGASFATGAYIGNALAAKGAAEAAKPDQEKTAAAAA